MLHSISDSIVNRYIIAACPALAGSDTGNDRTAVLPTTLGMKQPGPAEALNYNPRILIY
jgi:hypothetical protein